MSEEKPRKPRWSPDSWVKVILVVTLAQAMLFITLAILWRAIFTETPTPISPETILDILNALLAVFAVVVGYVLGSKGKD